MLFAPISRLAAPQFNEQAEAACSMQQACSVAALRQHE
jgi:hypothetical protein